MIRHRSTMKFLVLGALLVLSALHAIAGDSIYRVTVTNLTRGQIMSPPVVAAHQSGFDLFTPGESASPELAAVAEDADSAGLVALLGTEPGVHSVSVGGGGILPGESAAIEVGVSGNARFISLVSMLVTTNDTFAAIRGVRVDSSSDVAVNAVAYDAGSEANNESCAFIPGPPCGNPFQRATEGAEGYIHVHAGVHGGADLVPADHDWRNPVARIVIERISGNDPQGPRGFARWR